MKGSVSQSAEKSMIADWVTAGPLGLDDALAPLAVVERPDGSFERRRITLADIVRLVADEIERRQHP